jgi:hypothetical protein
LFVAIAILVSLAETRASETARRPSSDTPAVMAAARKIRPGQSAASVEAVLGVRGERFRFEGTTGFGRDPNNGRTTYTMTYEVAPGDYLSVIFYADDNTVAIVPDNEP